MPFDFFHNTIISSLHNKLFIFVDISTFADLYENKYKTNLQKVLDTQQYTGVRLSHSKGKSEYRDHRTREIGINSGGQDPTKR